MKSLNEIFDMCPSFYERESFANGYLKGYEQAEEDLALTLEDIKSIDKLLNQCVDYSNPYQEVLNRFKGLKNLNKSFTKSI